MEWPMKQVYEKLLQHFGPQHWWPGQSPFEVAVGAILTQNTNWRNVERAIGNLKAAGKLGPKAIASTPIEQLSELIRPAGYYRQKAKRLQNFARWLLQRYEGSIERMAEQDCQQLREELLALSGIGPETADSILLYAAGKLSFVVDAYTLRVAVRHGWVEPEVSYEELKQYFEERLPAELDIYNEMHALLVQVGKQFCQRRRPLCDSCPLRPVLPATGPYEPWSE